jgi:glutaredoxin
MKTDFTKVATATALFLFCSLPSSPLFAEELYKWVDREGNVTYQSEPPPADAWSVQKPKINTEVEQEEEAEVPVTVPLVFYVKPECPLCEQARAYFTEKNIAVTEVDISENADEAEKMLKQVGHNDVPTVIVGNKAITGFQEKTMSTILVNSGYKLSPAEGDEEAVEEGSEQGAQEGAEGFVQEAAPVQQ